MAIDLTPYIVIDNKFVFRWIAQAQVVSSYETFTDTATLVLPGKVINDGKIERIYKSGLLKKLMPIEIRLGYTNSYKLVFKGYITSVSNSLPFTIKCEDEMHLFKKNMVKPRFFKNAKLKDLVDYCSSSDLSSVVNPVSIGRWIIKEEVPAIKIFEEIKKMYNLHFFFRNNKLYAGLPFWTIYQNEVEFKFGTNIFENDNLEVIEADDQKIKLKAISILRDNTKLEVEVGDSDGALRTWYFDEVSSKSELKTYANFQLEQLKFTGLKGSFKTFGFPQIKQGDIAKLVDPVENNRDGSYLATKVVTDFGTSTAYQQTITLGRKM